MGPILKVLSVIIITVCFAMPVFSQSAVRIKFAKAATSTIVTGNLTGYRSSRTFVIRVRNGQTLSTAQVGDDHDITIFITTADGEIVGDSDASCNNRREITPTKAGDYRIKVVECQKADSWKGQFKFRIIVR